MSKISQIKAIEILDSRGNPTIETTIILEDGCIGKASVPSGSSTGKYEALELRDGDKSRFRGMGVLKAVKNVNIRISPLLINRDFNQSELDNLLIKLDSTPNKSRFGANSILSISLAFAKAKALSQKIPLYEYFKNISKNTDPYILPVPLMNILNGGKHAINSIDFQEFMIVPIGVKSFKEAVRAGSEIFFSLKKILIDEDLSTLVGDEGGFAPIIKTNEGALELLIEAIANTSYKAGIDVMLAMDAASSELFDEKFNRYELKLDNKILIAEKMISYFDTLIKKYPIISIEDPLQQDDWSGFKKITEKLNNIQVVGDDLFATNKNRLLTGIKNGSANCILIKLNQIGTVSETIETINFAKEAGYNFIISHRSGETEDSVIADFAVGVGARQVKIGSLSRSERIAKYNRLIEIEEELKNKAKYIGKRAFGKK